MEELKEINKAEQMIVDILRNRENQMEILSEQIKTDEREVAEAQKEMEAATVTGDLKAYKKAKHTLADAKDAKELHEKMLDAFIYKPLISPEDYKRTVQAIIDEVKPIEEKARGELAKLAENAHDVSETLTVVMNRANSVLHDLQSKIYRDADRMRGGKDGEKIIFTNGETKQVDLVSTIHWGNRGIDDYLYKEYKSNH